MQQLCGAFTELSVSFQGSLGIGTSSAGVCIWPVGPPLASSSARPAAALRVHPHRVPLLPGLLAQVDDRLGAVQVQKDQHANLRAQRFEQELPDALQSHRRVSGPVQEAKRGVPVVLVRLARPQRVPSEEPVFVLPRSATVAFFSAIGKLRGIRSRLL